jgi:hypothetical protein
LNYGRNEFAFQLQQNRASARDLFVRVLVDEHLLLPDRDFVESLLEDDEKETKLLPQLRTLPRLPRNLAHSWSDVVKLLESI